MSAGTLSMASRCFVFNNKLFYMNSFRWVQFENYQRRSLVAVRYVAQAARSVSLPIGYVFYKHRTDLEIGCFL
jgi:hypothetical protein